MKWTSAQALVGSLSQRKAYDFYRKRFRQHMGNKASKIIRRFPSAQTEFPMKKSADFRQGMKAEVWKSSIGEIPIHSFQLSKLDPCLVARREQKQHSMSLERTAFDVAEPAKPYFCCIGKKPEENSRKGFAVGGARHHLER